MKKFLTEKNYQKSILRITVPVGILLGFMFSFGFFLEKSGEVHFANPRVWLLVLGASIVLVAATSLIFVGLDVYSKKDSKVQLKLPENRKQWGLVFLILVLCYTITFLAVFPGFFAYDAKMAHWSYYYDQITTQHPWIHTILLGYICEFSISHLGHANVGIAIYIYVQMLFVAGCFTYTLYTMAKRTGHRVVVMISFLYYALFPTIHMYALCTTKDTLFTAVFLVALVLLLDMFEDADAFFSSKGKQISFVLFVLAALILRKNAVYAMIVFIPFLLVFLKKNWKKGAVLVGLSFLLFWVYDKPLANAVGVIDIGPKEALSVPSQQLARVYNEEREILTEEERSLLETFYPKEYLERYLPKLADYAKGMLNTEYFMENTGEYLKLWASVGARVPDIYINSFLVNTYGFWYPTATLDGYDGFDGIVGTPIENAEVYYFAYETESPGERWSLIPLLDNFYYQLSTKNLHTRVPGVSLLFSPGFMFWVYVIAFAYSVYRKQKASYPVFILMGILWLTVLLGPIALVRYVLFLFFGLPLLLSALFKKENCVNEEI